MIKIETLHHVSLPVTKLKEAEEFYEHVLGLEKLSRPDFNFDGAWYKLGDRQLHLIADPTSKPKPTFRENKELNSRDSHFAVRVNSYEETRQGERI